VAKSRFAYFTDEEVHAIHAFLSTRPSQAGGGGVHANR
jgi:hypothetical protein